MKKQFVTTSILKQTYNFTFDRLVFLIKVNSVLNFVWKKTETAEFRRVCMPIVSTFSLKSFHVFLAFFFHLFTKKTHYNEKLNADEENWKPKEVCPKLTKKTFRE